MLVSMLDMKGDRKELISSVFNLISGSISGIEASFNEFEDKQCSDSLNNEWFGLEFSKHL